MSGVEDNRKVDVILLSCSVGILGVHVIHGVYRQNGRINFKENLTETVDLRLKGQEKVIV